ncbi:hypothetical protein EON79_19965 [bacterium]|nr:MAG: hypothetical protein EON79_19965 [bacterium]
MALPERAHRYDHRGAREHLPEVLGVAHDHCHAREHQQAEFVRATQAMDALDVAVTFDRRHVICRRVAGRFTEWNVVGPNGPLPLDFDGLYDGPLSTPTLEAIYEAVQAEPIVGE